MKKLIYSSAITLIFISAFLFRCSKEKDTGNQEQQISFAISVPETKNGSETKGAAGYSLSDAKKIVLTIQNADGSSTRYSSSEVTIYVMNGVFFSQKLILKTGSYRLTEFLIMDSTENVIFTTPLKGSIEAQNVSCPLPIAFEVLKDISSPVNVEVISTENKSPEDFGLVSFQITEVKIINFLITVADRLSDSLLSARLTVSAGTWSHIQMLDPVAGNRVSVKDSAGIDAYKITIERDGYKMYHHLYSKDSLKLFNNNGNNSPVLIKLEKNNPTGTVTDIDGNIYKTVKIGNQCWMAENLKTTRLNDGTAIPNVVVDSEWIALTTPSYCWYNNDDASYKATFGALYNWYAVNTGKLCPTGWHVPSFDEWVILYNPDLANSGVVIANGISISGSELMEPGTTHWSKSEITGTNETGFTALPGGFRSGSFMYINYRSRYWTSNLTYIDHVNYYPIPITSSYNNSPMWRWQAKRDGLSIRCIKDSI
jgi:uncharacterized protein (TIGR02145 family)